MPPKVEEEERSTISELSTSPRCFRIHVYRGFMDRDQLLETDLEQLIKRLLQKYLNDSNGHCNDNETNMDKRLHVNISPVPMETFGMEESLSVVYVVGRKSLRIKKSTMFANLFPGLLLRLYIWMRQLSRSDIADMHIPIDNMFEIGIVKDI